MNTSLIAFAVSAVLVFGLLLGLAFASLGVGALEWMFGRPRLLFLKSQHGDKGLAFSFSWNNSKEEAKIDFFRVRLFNPFSSPTQVEISKALEGHSSSFALDLNLGDEFAKIASVNSSKATIEIELKSNSNGVSFQYEMKADTFSKKRNAAVKTLEDYKAKLAESGPELDFGPPARSFIADTVPGKGHQLKVATNPVFAGEFAAGGAATAVAGAPAAAPAQNFAITKVWIAPGCIVCNACENIFPEVFQVLPDTCVIRPNAPLDNGLKVQEAAEACPVEVIKFNKA